MKLSILAAIAVLIVGVLPASAQRRSERITCYRERNVISCPGYGSFNLRNNNRNYDDGYKNSDRYEDNNYRNGNNRRYDNNNGLRAINEIYIQVLGRRTDLDGARTYIQALNSGWTLERVRHDIAYSGESEQVINQAYREILRRDVDAGGLETYKRYLASGKTIRDLRRELARSPEARGRY